MLLLNISEKNYKLKKRLYVATLRDAKVFSCPYLGVSVRSTYINLLNESNFYSRLQKKELRLHF